jgi:hypothetical protein
MRAMRFSFALALLTALGCAGKAAGPPPGPAQKREYPGRLVPSEALGRPFTVRQRLTAQHQGRTLPTLEAVLQVHDGVLHLVGLTPLGTRAFVITQKGITITAENLMKETAPLEPRDVLNDIHRVFFRGLYVGKPAPYDGQYSGSDDSESITESWRNGRLVHRSFTRPDHPGTIEIDFSGPGEVIARDVALHNGWFGYQLRIVTVEQQWLAP